MGFWDTVGKIAQASMDAMNDMAERQGRSNLARGSKYRNTEKYKAYKERVNEISVANKERRYAKKEEERAKRMEQLAGK